jgi:hypothetical protein
LFGKTGASMTIKMLSAEEPDIVVRVGVEQL